MRLTIVHMEKCCYPNVHLLRWEKCYSNVHLITRWEKCCPHGEVLPRCPPTHQMGEVLLKILLKCPPAHQVGEVLPTWRSVTQMSTCSPDGRSVTQNLSQMSTCSPGVLEKCCPPPHQTANLQPMSKLSIFWVACIQRVLSSWDTRISSVLLIWHENRSLVWAVMIFNDFLNCVKSWIFYQDMSTRMV